MRWSCSCAMFMLVAALLVPSRAAADITTYTDRDAWFEAVSPGGSVPITTIGFSEFPAETEITDQYAHLGVNFSGVNSISGPGCIIYPQDCWALEGGIGGVTVDFDAPRHALALDHPGDAFIELFRNGMQFASIDFGGGGLGNFSGIVSTQPFDSAVLSDGSPPSFIDDLHFVTIPVPGSIACIGVSLLCRPGRRRT